MLYLARKLMRRGLGQLYASPGTWNEQPLPEHLANSPVVAKYRQDGKDMGLEFQSTFAVDVKAMTECRSLIFASSDRQTYAAVGLSGRIDEKWSYPPQITLCIETQFRNGHRVFTTNGETSYRPMPQHPTYGQHVVWTDDLGELLAIHREKVAELQNAGHQPMAMTLQGFLLLQGELHRRGQVFWNERPFSWSDAWHYAFDLKRKDPRVRYVASPDGEDSAGRIARVLGLTAERSMW